MRTRLVVIGILLASRLCLHAETKEPLSVTLLVSAQDTMKAEVVSFLNREIRALRDVEIVEAHPRFIISIVALPLTRGADRTDGFALSVVVTKPIRLESLGEFAHALGGRAEQVFQIAQADCAGAQTLEGHFLQTGPSESLATLCQKIIAQIDGDIFEACRKNERERLLEEKNRAREREANPK